MDGLGVQQKYLAVADFSPRLVEQARAWLTRQELAAWARFRDASRGNVWLIGRWLSKQIVGVWHRQLSPHQLEIRSRDAAGRAVRPAAYVDQLRLDVNLSISHSARGVWAAGCLAPRRIGVDLIEPFLGSDGFLRTWFTAGEQRWINAAGRDQAAVLWAAKEAFYKATHCGERFRARRIDVRAWGPTLLEARHVTARVAPGARPRRRAALVNICVVDGHIGALVIAPSTTDSSGGNSSEGTRND